MLDQLAQMSGFENAKDMNHHVASVDISTPEKLARFEKWKNEDGTKRGLMVVIVANSNRPSTEDEDSA